MEKRQRKQFWKGWKKLRTAFKILFIAILIYLLIQFLSDFIHHYTYIVGKVTEQGDTIQHLQEQVHTMSDTNAQITEQLQQAQHNLDLANLKIDSLTNEKLVKQVPKINIVGQPTTMTIDDIKAEIEPQLKITDPTVPAVIVGTLAILKTLVFKITAF